MNYPPIKVEKYDTVRESSADTPYSSSLPQLKMDLYKSRNISSLKDKYYNTKLFSSAAHPHIKNFKATIASTYSKISSKKTLASSNETVIRECVSTASLHSYSPSQKKKYKVTNTQRGTFI